MLPPPTIIAGDFNARLHYRDQDEHPHIGPHYIGKGRTYAQNADPDTQDNRHRFVTLLMSYNLIAQNTRFQKPTRKLLTFQDNFDSQNDTTLDYIITPKRWQNIITNVEAKQHKVPDSDHYPVTATVRIKLRKPKPPADPTKIKFTRPQEGHNGHYNKIIDEQFQNTPINEIYWEDFSSTLISAAKTAFPIQEQRPRKDYISAETWQLIQQRQQLSQHDHNNHEQIQTLRKQIRNAARKDRDHYLVDKVNKDLNIRDQWFGVEMIKQPFSP